MSETDDMYRKIYDDAQTALDKILGPDEEDGAGEGLVADIRLVGEQRDEARAAIDRVRRLIDSYPPGSDFAESGAQELFRRTLDGTHQGQPVT